MPKVSWSTPFDHSTDAAFRAWGLDLSTRLATAGLVKTTDTGQINWVTVTKPAVSTYAGYEIWRFNDSLQSTSPVFIRIEYGTSNNTQTPSFRITVGSATNGAGTIQGLATSARIVQTTGVLVANASTTNFSSYMTHTAGFFGFVFKMGASVSLMPLCGFTIQRSTNNTGSPTSEAVMLITSGSSATNTDNANVSVIYYNQSLVSNASDGRDLAVIPHRITSSLVGFSPQLYVTWLSLPKMTPNLYTAAYIKAEATDGFEFSTTLVGTSARSYITIGSALRSCAYYGATAVLGAAMLWED